MNRSLYHRALTRLALLLIFLVISIPLDLVAQTDERWSTPMKLHEGTGSIREPALASDQTDALHAFWTYSEEGLPMTLYYARWENDAWTQPVDVIATPSIHGPSAAVDQHGRVHVIWQGTNNTLFYSSADAEGAASATAWASPQPLAQSNPQAQIVTDETGTLHVIYPAVVEGGVYYMASSDGGQSWTAPVRVAAPVNLDATANFTRLAAAPGGVLHAVWTELTLPNGWPPYGIYYARSTDEGHAWSIPTEISGDTHLEANILAFNTSTVHIVWNAPAGISGRYHRWSSDEGVTWSPANQVVSPELKGGSTGPPGLVEDSAGVVHVIVNTGDTVPRSGEGEFGATMYTAWTGSRWLPALNISSPAPNYSSLINEESVLAITGGNRLHVLFFGDEAHTLWYTSSLTTAPRVPSQAFAGPASLDPDAEASSTGTPPPDNESQAVSTSAVLSSTRGNAPTPNIVSRMNPLVIAVAPALMFIVAVVFFALNRRRAR